MLRLIVWIVIGVLALSFFGISLRELVQDPQTQDNFSFILGLLQNGWHLLTAWIDSLKGIFHSPFTFTKH